MAERMRSRIANERLSIVIIRRWDFLRFILHYITLYYTMLHDIALHYITLYYS